ncbi:Eco57I restriction-modification methylase domain-containing protein [Haloarcula sp. KBTZ06]|uniref:Eco57I restriction-modification methylase domain-containing protein n=1 Tax=Haloarcula sp. KBTZ06 TaxID=3402682 RepID=UPI003B42A2B5
MTLQQIVAADIAGWDSLEDIASSFEDRGLKPRPDMGEDYQLPLQLSDDEFIILVEAGPGENARDFKPDTMDRHTNLVATNDFESFTFITRVRSWDQQHGRIKYQKLSFEKEQFERDSGEKRTILQKLNSIEYGSSAAIYGDLYDTKRVVKEFYDQFEDLRTDLVEEVAGIPDNQKDSKQRYVQVVLDRMIFLYFIQEKRLLDYDTDYLRDRHDEIAAEDGDVYEEFYDPLFFELLAEGKDGGDFFGKLPYLNGGLFSKGPVEKEFENARLGKKAEETNALFDQILDFLSDWNWNVDERLDIVDPKNLSPEVLGHIFEQTVNQKEMGAYYTPEEVTGFMARQTIHPYLLDQLNETTDSEYTGIDDVFGFQESGPDTDSLAIADGGTITQQAATENVDTKHIETLYHDILKDIKILDPAVGSGAFLLAAQEVLLDIYMQCIEFFQQLKTEGEAWRLESRTREELDTIMSGRGTPMLYAKRAIILNNLYGVDIDEGATEICKLRLWLSMVADIEDEPGEVEPLPNIDFNIRPGDSLIGFNSPEVVVDEQKLLITERLKDDLKQYRESIREYKSAETEISDRRGELDDLHDEMQKKLDDWFADLPDIEVEDDISGAEELREVISSSTEKIKLKLKFSDPIDDDLDQKLNEMGFRTWKTAANLEMGNDDVLAGRPEEIFATVDQNKLSRVFVQRGLLRGDIEKLNPFHWVMEFPEVYGAVGNGGMNQDKSGFDVILENPPYVRIGSVDELKRDIYKDLYETATGRCDLYVPFLERTFDLLSDSGRTSVITSNSFMRTEYGEPLREHLLNNYGMEKIYDFTSYSAFEDVTIYSAILFGNQYAGMSIDGVSIRSKAAKDEIIDSRFDPEDRDDIVKFNYPPEELGSDRWLMLTQEERTAREKVEENCNLHLDDEEEFTIGSPLITGRKRILQKDVIDESENSFTIEGKDGHCEVKKGIWKRTIIPEHTKRWTLTLPDKITFFPYKTINGEYELIDETEFKSNYPETYELLEGYKEDLLSRKDSRRTWKELGRPWYSLVRRGSPKYFERDKIVTDMVVNGPRFCLDTKGQLFRRGPSIGITPHSMDPYYLTGLLNSQVIFSYLKPICSPMDNGYMKIESEHLNEVPIYRPDITDECSQKAEAVLDDYQGDYQALSTKIRDEGISSVVSVDMHEKKIAANIVRELSKRLVITPDTLSAKEVSNLERLNDYLVGRLFELEKAEVDALANI